jgi:cytochrome c oxidase cbb3-type subunit 2
LYPKPRNFQYSRFRLVSNAGSIPSDEDLRAVIVRGLPGTAMPAHPHLDGSEVDELIREVLRIRRGAIRQRIIEFWMEDSDEEQIDESQIDAMVAQHFRVGKRLDAPANRIADAATIARGKELFARLSCSVCHGPEGRGDGELYLIDDLGQRVLPRDLVFGRFKGGHGPMSVYRRLALGMPGTPMPAQAAVSENDLIALVDYVGSLSREPKQELTNYQRSIRLLER